MSSIEVVQPRILNTRFVLALIALIALIVFSFALVMTLRHQATSDQNTHALIVRNHALFNQNSALIAEIKAGDAESASERVILLENQRSLLAYTKQLDARELSLLAYLRKHGIRLPTRLVSVIEPPTLRVVTVRATTTNKARGKKHHGKK